MNLKKNNAQYFCHLLSVLERKSNVLTNAQLGDSQHATVRELDGYQLSQFPGNGEWEERGCLGRRGERVEENTCFELPNTVFPLCHY